MLEYLPAEKENRINWSLNVERILAPACLLTGLAAYFSITATGEQRYGDRVAADGGAT